MTDMAPFKRLLKKTWFRICTIILLLIVTGLIILPHVLRIKLEQWMVANGADRAVVGKIELNLFTGEASVKGVKVIIGEKTVLADSDVYLNLNYRALFHHEALVQSASLHNVIFDIERSADDRWRFGFFTAPEKSEKAESPEKQEQPWFFAADQLEIFDSTIHYRQPGLQATLSIEEGRLKRFSTAPSDISGKLTLRGKLNDAPVYLQLNTLQLNPGTDITGTLKISDIRLEDFADLLRKSFSSLAGRIGLEGDFHFALSKENTILADYDGMVSLGNSDIAGSGSVFTGENVTWEGRLAYRQREQSSADLFTLNGKLSGTAIGAALPEQDLRLTQNTFTLTGNAAFPLEDIRQVQGNAEVQAQGFQLGKNASQDKMLMLDDFSLTGLHVQPGEPLVVETITAGQFVFPYPANTKIRITVPEIRLVNLQTDDLVSFSLQEGSLQGFQLQNTENEKEIASIENIILTDTKFDKTFNLAAALLTIHNAKLPGPGSESGGDPLFSFADLKVGQPEWSSNSNLQIQQIAVGDLQADIIREKEGALNFSHTLQNFRSDSGDQPSQNASSAVEVQSNPPPFSYRINEILVTGKSDIRFDDLTLDKPFHANLSIDTLQVKNIDSHDTEKSASYELTGSLDNADTPLKIQGTFNRPADGLSLHQTLSLKNYPMVGLSPYSIQYLGIEPTQGTLNVVSDLTYSKGYLDLKKTWLLKKLAIKTVNADREAKFSSQLPMSLDSALSLLKDSDDNIELSMPISGNIDDLDFGISGLFITPLSKAIVSASSSYLLYTLGPYGAAAFVGLKLGEKLMETRLPAVEFASGLSTITDEHKKYLQRIAEILKNRPKIDLQICPYVVPADKLEPVQQQKDPKEPEPPSAGAGEAKQEMAAEALGGKEREALSALGKERADAIKNYLVQTYDIDPGRLIVCLPEIDTAKDAVPRVELKI